MSRLTALALLILTAAACASSEEIVARDVVGDIPWKVTETSRYRLLKDDEAIGSAEISISEQSDALTVFDQKFEIPEQKVTDTVSVAAKSETLRPVTTGRVIDGPQGVRHCDAKYEGGSATVDQQSEKDKRTDVLAVPEKSYDTWTDLFLWRTLPFRDGYETTYAGVLSCSLGKPDLISEVLQVNGLETVTVPAGTFEAWHLEIRSGGETQNAWYTNDDTRTLVRYDNGDLVFELMPTA